MKIEADLIAIRQAKQAERQSMLVMARGEIDTPKQPTSNITGSPHEGNTANTENSKDRNTLPTKTLIAEYESEGKNAMELDDDPIEDANNCNSNDSMGANSGDDGFQQHKILKSE